MSKMGRPARYWYAVFSSLTMPASEEAETGAPERKSSGAQKTEVDNFCLVQSPHKVLLKIFKKHILT
eukprot:5893260-Amphidinium_carterae.1